MTDFPEDDDFAAMLEESLNKERKRPSVGDKVQATVLQVGRESLVLDLGDGQDALMELSELGSAEDRPEVREGDVLDAYVLRLQEGVAELGMTLARVHGGPNQFEEARDSGLPVQGVITEVNKGGYVVEVGKTRCFCPLGAMDINFIDDPNALIGQKHLFRVTELRGKRDVVLSRRVLLQEERAEAAAETRERLEVGARFRGKVARVRDFGAFVDLGGVDGLVPASELGYGRVRPQEVVSEGQAVDVEVLRIEEGPDGKERIALSMKALLDDPFDEVAPLLTPGTILAGTVTRVQPFGAFVELVPGVEGLLHVSAFGKRISHPSDVVKPEQTVAVRVDGVDTITRRISLHHVDQAELEALGSAADGATATDLRILRQAAPPSASGAPALRVGDIRDVTVDRVERFGVFVSWPGGQGLIPGRELGVPRNTELRRLFPEGTEMKALVIEIREDGKITLSKTAVERAEERADTEAWQQSSRPSSGGGLGTLGDLLRFKQEEEE